MFDGRSLELDTLVSRSGIVGPGGVTTSELWVVGLMTGPSPSELYPDGSGADIAEGESQADPKHQRNLLTPPILASGD